MTLVQPRLSTACSILSHDYSTHLAHVHTESLIHTLNNLARVNALCLVVLSFVVTNSVLGKLRMRQQNTKPALPLDSTPERRTDLFFIVIPVAALIIFHLLLPYFPASFKIKSSLKGQSRR